MINVERKKWQNYVICELFVSLKNEGYHIFLITLFNHNQHGIEMN